MENFELDVNALQMLPGMEAQLLTLEGNCGPVSCPVSCTVSCQSTD